MCVEKDQYRSPHSSGVRAGETTSPVTVILPLKKPKMSSFSCSTGTELRYRLSALDDDHGLALGLDLVHDGEAVNFEFAGRDNLHDHGGCTMVIRKLMF
jgi:hypothetical protein